jgi:hypothetical protein
MDVATSINGVPIRLTDERWQHIITNRNNLRRLKPEVPRTISDPDTVFQWVDRSSVAHSAGIMGKTMVVVYGQVSDADGFVITAWLTSKPQKAGRGTVVWTRQ